MSKKIDEIVQEGISRRHQKAIVDYTLSRKPFPFSEIAAVKSENHSEAYFMLTFADRSYTAADVQAKYGAPYDTDVVQWYSVFKYRMDSPHYTSKAVFEIDPIDGAVLKVSISLKTKKAQERKEQPLASTRQPRPPFSIENPRCPGFRGAQRLLTCRNRADEFEGSRLFR